MFELRRLRLLYELSVRGTLGAVAEALAYSPSTVSQQLAVLEKEVGLPLTEADGRRVRLTPHGAALARHAKQMLDLDERARVELAQAGSQPTTVRLAAIHTSVHPLVSSALSALEATRPDVRVNVTVEPPERALTELAARTYDIVIAEQYAGVTRAHDASLARTPIGADPLRLAVPVSDDATTVGACRGRHWVMEPAGTASRQWATQQCRAEGFEPDVRFEVADPQIHMQLIADGHAVGFLPGLVGGGHRLPVRLVELPVQPTRELFTATRAASAGRDDLASLHGALVAAFASLGGA